ncbi:MAG: zf-HC2 domain-containing protein [Fidelibacterota bacterium]|nr:MAG: zf-HC2 domain-containing protein [Candidatus Neomarinimicrobiota bacterium]
MNCSQFRLKISPYLDSELSFTELKNFKEHSESCSSCAELVSNMEGIRLALVGSLDTSLSPDFVPRLQARLRAEINRAPSWWRQLATPRIMGFSPISLSGLAAAVLALLVIGVSLLNQESAPLVDPPKRSMGQNPPAMMIPNPSGTSQTASPLLTTSPNDSILDQHDSSQRDFSRQIKYVNQPRRE